MLSGLQAVATAGSVRVETIELGTDARGTEEGREGVCGAGDKVPGNDRNEA